MASVRRIIQFGAKSRIHVSNLGGINNGGSTINRLGASANPSYRWLSWSSSGNWLDYGRNSPNRKLDALDLARRIEAKGIPSKDAEAVTSAVIEVFNESMETIKAEMQKIRMAQKAKSSNFNSFEQSLLDHNFSMLQHEVEKLQNDIEKLRDELSLANRSVETTNLTKEPGQGIFSSRNIKVACWMITIFICWMPVLDQVHKS